MTTMVFGLYAGNLEKSLWYNEKEGVEKSPGHFEILKTNKQTA